MASSTLTLPDTITTRSYQQEMLNASLVENIIIAQDTGSGKTHVAVLRIKIECDREPNKVSWFIAPTVALCEQQHSVIQKEIGSVGLIHGGLEPKQWTDPNLWKDILTRNRVIVSTPQVLLDALSHGHISLGLQIGLIVFDEAHHAKNDHPMNCIMRSFYFNLAVRQSTKTSHGPVREERPIILGLTASPMFGGNAAMAFRTLEMNLDSIIRSPRLHRDDLEAHVHRPEFRHVLYNAPWTDTTCFAASKNFQALNRVAGSMDIHRDPGVISLREKLAELPLGPERTRLDQELSKTIQKSNTYTHKGIKDLLAVAHDICLNLGPWAADWYIHRVVEVALQNASPLGNIANEWRSKEKVYLIEHIQNINSTPVSYEPQAIESGLSDKLRVLIQTLEEEKTWAESFNELYSGIVFVERRDAVLALVTVLEHHPRTKDQFRVGSLVGSSESRSRTAFLDLTRKIPRQSHAETLADFRSGEKNLIVATAVAEEGLDIQACGNVIRWDVPNNMVSWAQSRGRARRKRSSFILMFQRGDDARVEGFEQLERDMVAQYNAQRNALKQSPPPPSETDDEVEPCEFKVEKTGALLTLQAAISYLNHFCSVLPNSRHTNNVAVYDIDPPDLPEGWHALDAQQQAPQGPQGPFGCTLTLPKGLPPKLRVYTVERKYLSKRSACRHVAFKAYVNLYNEGLLNDHLLPEPSGIEPELEQEVKDMLEDIAKRDGTASVASQLNPWLPRTEKENWWSTEILAEGLPSLTLFTHVEIPALGTDELPVLYHPGRGKIEVKLGPAKQVHLSQGDLMEARWFTRRLVWSLYGSKLKWGHLDFAYLFVVNADPHGDTWLSRRRWSIEQQGNTDTERSALVNAEAFAAEYGYVTDLTWVRDSRTFGKLHRFVSWHHERLTPEEEEEIRTRRVYSRFDDVQVTYPLLLVEVLPQRSNFLLPNPIPTTPPKQLFLLVKYAYFELLSPAECEYSHIIPSILRRLETAMIVRSLKSTLFPSAPLAKIPLLSLTTAVTAPAAEDQTNYERLETLGDAVLKFIVAVNLMASYPSWHEGYLTRRKDHAVANSRLAKEAIQRHVFQWIIRTRFSPKRFKPLYLSVFEEPAVTSVDPPEATNYEPVVSRGKTHKEVEELSTKMLADVVESLIGAAYLHGGFDLGVSSIRLFGLGLEWNTLPDCVTTILSRVEHTDEASAQLNHVEQMLGYTFQRKLLLVEALMHASYQFDDRTVSYERMEFLGDALLDMVVADTLYRYPGKSYAPHDIHIRKSAVVNTHFLAYICLRCTLEVDASMPGPDMHGEIVMQPKTDTIRLFRCLYHLSHRISEDQDLTFRRFDKLRDEIEEALVTGRMFPWATLTRLQAPKLFSDMIESLLGAVYLDSEGNMETVKTLLRKLGVLSYLERIIRDDVDVRHPVSRLSVWAAQQQKEVKYEYTEGKGLKICTISVEGRVAVHASAERRGHASQEEARFAAAEKAISLWEVK